MWELKVIILLLATEVLNVGNNTLSKAAMAKGMSNYVFTTYIHLVAVIFLVPSAFLVHSLSLTNEHQLEQENSTSINQSWYSIATVLAGCSLIIHDLMKSLTHQCFVQVSVRVPSSCGCSIFLFIGIRYSSPTLASAMNNLCPAFTFISAIIFRMEILDLREKSSLLKLIGTIVSIIGAFIMTLYQGLPIIIFPSSSTNPSLHTLRESQLNWAIGGFFLATSCIFLALSFVAKTWIARDFQSEVLITLIVFFFETIMAAIVTAVAEKDNPSVWLPNLGIEWISITVGALEVGVANVIQIWACRKKGPLFVAMFKPLEMIIAVTLGVSFLKDVLHLGSVIGGMVIAIGFYTVIKGKAEEEVQNRLSNCSSETFRDHKVPLLQNKNMDV